MLRRNRSPSCRLPPLSSTATLSRPTMNPMFAMAPSFCTEAISSAPRRMWIPRAISVVSSDVRSSAPPLNPGAQHRQNPPSTACRRDINERPRMTGEAYPELRRALLRILCARHSNGVLEDRCRDLQCEIRFFCPLLPIADAASYPWGVNASGSGGSVSYRSRHGSIGTKGFSPRTGIPGLSFRQGWRFDPFADSRCSGGPGLLHDSRGRLRQIHLAEDCLVTRIIRQALKQRFAHNLKETRILLAVGSLQPRKREIVLAAKREGLGHVERTSLIPRLYLRLQRLFGFGVLAECVQDAGQ